MDNADGNGNALLRYNDRHTEIKRGEQSAEKEVIACKSRGNAPNF